MTKINKVANFYSSFIKPGDLCYDVGANVGDRTAALLQIAAQVIAIEPQPSCAKKIRKRFQNKITILETGLSDKPGEIELYLTRTSTIASMNKKWINSVKQQRFKKYNWNHKVKVPLTTLDKVIASYGKPKFIKIDVEGFELNVLKGLHHKIDYICFEYVPEIIQIATACVDRLMSLSLDYKFNWSERETMVFGLKDWVNGEEMKNLLSQTQGSLTFGDVYAKITKNTSS